jgi:uncharacterized protein YoxC
MHYLRAQIYSPEKNNTTMKYTHVLAGLMCLLLINACGNKIDETVVTNIQESGEKVQAGKSQLAGIIERTKVLADKIALVPTDVQKKKEFIEFYQIASAVSARKMPLEDMYTDMETKLQSLEEGFRSGKVKKEEVMKELEMINYQSSEMQNKLPVIVHISDSLVGVYDKMIVGATGTPQPVQLPDAAGILPSSTGTGIPGAAAAASSTSPSSTGTGTGTGAAQNTGTSTVPTGTDAQAVDKERMMKSGEKKVNKTLINQ